MTHSHEDITKRKTEDKSHADCMGNKRKSRTTDGENNCKDSTLGNTSKEKTDNSKAHTYCMGSKGKSKTTDGGKNVETLY
eukprot:2062609-Heterocapsa_arctica.AAC.2